MKKNKRFLTRYSDTLLLMLGLCMLALFLWIGINAFQMEPDSKNLEESEAFDENFTITETSAGFYLYDRDLTPVYIDQEIVLESEMEFNLLCVNACEIDLCYSLVVLINDCCQTLNVETVNGDKVENSSCLLAGDSIMLNIKYTTRARQKDDNEIRFVLLYYPIINSSEESGMVAVADTVEIHPLDWNINPEYVESNWLEVEYIQLSSDVNTNGAWITLEKQESVPAFKYVLEVFDNTTAFFNATGTSDNYYGMVFIDGVPQKIGNDSVFEWKQKQNNMVSAELDLGFIKGKTIFAYMYESGGSIEDTYVTPLYYAK